MAANGRTGERLAEDCECREMRAFARAFPRAADVTPSAGERIVRETLEGLPERARLLVALRFLEGLGLEDLSAALGLSPSDADREIGAALSAIEQALDRASGKEASESR
ncbi:MAG: sigma factor-like helix-turn-helix DNA-binding protein [Candidatus Eisenbacteria bacterium]